MYGTGRPVTWQSTIIRPPFLIYVKSSRAIGFFLTFQLTLFDLTSTEWHAHKFEYRAANIHPTELIQTMAEFLTADSLAAKHGQNEGPTKCDMHFYVMPVSIMYAIRVRNVSFLAEQQK